MFEKDQQNGQTLLNVITKWSPSFRSKALKFLIFIPLITIFLTLGYGYLTIIEAKEHSIATVKFMKEAKENTIIGTIVENCKHAQNQTRYVKLDIIEKIQEEYGDDIDRMKEDYLEYNIHNPFYSIIDKILRYHYVNIDNDRNRIIVTTRDRILLDNSNLYAKYSFQTWDKYFNESTHPEFSKRAIRLVQEQNDLTILWVDNEFSIDVEHIDWDPAYDLPDFVSEKIKNKQMEEMYNFSILITEYIYQHQDIFGIPDNYDGKSTTNDKLYIIQFMSIKDIFDSTPTLLKTLEHYDDSIYQEKLKCTNMIRQRTIVILLTILLEIITFIGIWTLVEYYVYSNQNTKTLNKLNSEE